MSTNNESKTNAFDRYQEAAGRTANNDIDAVLERLKNNPQLVTLLNDALGLAGEAGEFADHIKKVVFHGHALDQDYSVKELGDQLWYIADAAKALGVKLSAVAGGNVKKLQARYPEGFDKDRSINREG